MWIKLLGVVTLIILFITTSLYILTAVFGIYIPVSSLKRFISGERPRFEANKIMVTFKDDVSKEQAGEFLDEWEKKGLSKQNRSILNTYPTPWQANLPIDFFSTSSPPGTRAGMLRNLYESLKQDSQVSDVKLYDDYEFGDRIMQTWEGSPIENILIVKLSPDASLEQFLNDYPQIAIIPPDYLPQNTKEKIDPEQLIIINNAKEEIELITNLFHQQKVSKIEIISSIKTTKLAFQLEFPPNFTRQELEQLFGPRLNPESKFFRDLFNKIDLFVDSGTEQEWADKLGSDPRVDFAALNHFMYID